MLNVRGPLQQLRTGFWENVSTCPDAQGNGFYTPGLGTSTAIADGETTTSSLATTTASASRTCIPSACPAPSSGISATTPRSDPRSPTHSEVKRDYIEDPDASPFEDFKFLSQHRRRPVLAGTALERRCRQDALGGGLLHLRVKVRMRTAPEQPLMSGIWDGTRPGNQSILGGLGFTLVRWIDAPGGGSGPILGPTARSSKATARCSASTTRTAPETNSWSLFGQTEYDFTDRLTGIVGFRHRREQGASLRVEPGRLPARRAHAQWARTSLPI
ncbi:MAG: hypothetical protein IPN13_08015 [Bacteroidetes bacterium]|nr:hypothetical protein [Bacteroidota bacterium]